MHPATRAKKLNIFHLQEGSIRGECELTTTWESEGNSYKTFFFFVFKWCGRESVRRVGEKSGVLGRGSINCQSANRSSARDRWAVIATGKVDVPWRREITTRL
jgi:hypothetical protein